MSKKKTLANKRIREGDQVIVTAGNDKGKTGTILSRHGDRIIVQGINVRKKHVKQTQENQAGGIIDIDCPINASNVQLCVNDKPVKLRVRENEGRELYYLENGKETSYRSVKKTK